MADAAAEVDPAALAYIRQLVEHFESTSFQEACYDQIDEEHDADIFQGRPEPSPVPADVARALDTVEDLLWKGSPTLAAYERQEIRDKRFQQEKFVADVMAGIRLIEEQIASHRDAIEAKRRRLRAVRAGVPRDLGLLSALTAAPPPVDGEAGRAEATGAVVSLLERLNRASEEEAALVAAVESLRASLPGLLEQLQQAWEEAEEEEAQLKAMPQLLGHGEDLCLFFDSQKRFVQSLGVLREFMEKQA